MATTASGCVGNSPRDFTVENHRYVSRDYFSTLGIAISRGRPFADADFLPDSQPVVIINEAFASRHFPNQDALGKRMKMGQTADSPFAWMTVIGIIKDVKHTSLEDERKPEMYRPFMQLTSFENQREMTFAIRTTQPLESLLATLRQEVFSLDSDQPIANIASMQWLRDQSVARREFGLLLFATFAAVALLLACLGIYGVLSYTVAQHTREIGIRMALGAQTRDILKLIFGHGLLLTLTGIALGIGAALALTRFMASLLYEITATDSLTFLVVPLVLLLVALLACWLPARRALKVAPMEALRYE